MSPIQGFTRFRSHQIGKQSAILTPVAATRVVPYRGPIVVNPNRTQPDVDTGSLDPIIAAFAGAKNVTSQWQGKLAFDDLPYILAAAGKGGVSPTGGGAAKTWTFQYASLSADDFEYLTDEWGDDTNASDGIQAFGGVVNQYTAGYGEDLSAYDLSADLVYSGANLATARTPALSVDQTPIWVTGADVEFYLNTTAGAIGTTKWTDTVHSLSWQWNNNLDLKRFSNGSGSRFNLAGYGRGTREITLTVQVAKTTATMAERATLDDDPVPLRYVEVKNTNPAIITGSTPYSWSRRARVELISAADGNIGGNSTITFVYRVKYDSTLTYAVKDVVVCALAAL